MRRDVSLDKTHFGLEVGLDLWRGELVTSPKTLGRKSIIV
jgi:hypothetical protein